MPLPRGGDELLRLSRVSPSKRRQWREQACVASRGEAGCSHKILTRDQVQTAINEGIPFAIRMADGEKYEVTERYQVALGRTAVIVVGPDDMPHTLPLLTMTGICYLRPKQ